jgi:hypothetical protein
MDEDQVERFTAVSFGMLAFVMLGLSVLPITFTPETSERGKDCLTLA